MTTQSDIEHNTELLIHASRKGDIDDIKRLIPISDPKSEKWGALQVVASEGYLDCVKRLILVSDPKANGSQALREAAENGHTEIVKLLIPVSVPKAHDSLALAWAANEGNLEIVKQLIPVSDPKANDSWALQAAVKNNRINTIKLLIPVSDYTLVMQTLLDNNANAGVYHIQYDTTVFQQCIDEYEALQQKNHLQETIDGVVVNKLHSVKRKM